MLKIQSNEAWAAGQVAHLPERWRGRLLRRWEDVRSHYDDLTISSKNDAGRAANIELREITEKLGKVRLSLDASDSEICTRAEELAGACMDVGRIQSSIEAVRAGMESFVRSCQIEPPSDKVETRPAIARMTCRDWWRRGLRKMHAKAVEGVAIQLGYVNRARDLYVSNESLARRQQQIKRNAAMMENTIMRNELEQEFNLAELAAKGTGNKAIRRGELMTRIAGFEKIAVECGHGGLFLTVTCPSRMHKWVSAGNGRVFENAKYDGTTPKQAQVYLGKCWQRIRSALARRKIALYGFRIAEPHHDACPHWHMLFFHEAGVMDAVVEVFRKYMLADSPDEKGAAEHRVKADEVIDWKRGTAAGYIAKYVAKNIDGLHVEDDLYGNPAMETSMRVEAWASTWGIRQFQQIGGAPVGVWRELRRVKEMPEGAPGHLKAAHMAVNKIEVDSAIQDTEVKEKAADWAGYVKAQGGVFVGRKAAIKIATEETDGLGRYGERLAPRPVGVATVGGEFYRDGIIPDRFRLVEWLVRSVRHVWQVVRRGVKAAVFSPPWTRVNNCTVEGVEVELQKRGGAVGRGGKEHGQGTGLCKSSGGGDFNADYLGIQNAFGAC